jgi:hypothetical protein
MKIGFTGSSKYVTKEQQLSLAEVLAENCVVEDYARPEFHHGDCVEADALAHDLAHQLKYYIVVHPPINNKARAFKSGDLILATLPYLIRNKRIVEATEKLIAVPAQKEEQFRRSGTWFTIRYARKTGKPVTLIYPDGTIA